MLTVSCALERKLKNQKAQMILLEPIVHVAVNEVPSKTDIGLDIGLSLVAVRIARALTVLSCLATSWISASSSSSCRYWAMNAKQANREIAHGTLEEKRLLKLNAQKSSSESIDGSSRFSGTSAAR